MKKISVIIILYHSKHLLSDIIGNVIDKIKSIGEIILINNSSENIDEFSSELTSVIYAPRNLGYGSAINLGVSRSNFEYLLILNPDIYIKTFRVNRIIENEFHNKAIFSGYNPSRPGHSLKFPNLFSTFLANSICELKKWNWLEEKIHFRKVNKSKAEFANVDYLSGALLFMHKDVFDKIGGFDSHFFLYYEETDFCKRALNAGYRSKSTGNIVFEPRNEKSSAVDVNLIKVKSGILSSKYYHKKHSNPLGTELTFKLAKYIITVVIFFLGPVSLFNKAIKTKRKELILRRSFF